MSERLSVGFVLPHFWPSVGGVEHYTGHMVGACQRAGHHVFVITTGAGWQPRVEDREGVRIHRLPVLARASNTPLHPLWPRWVRQILAREEPDVLNGHTPVPVLADLAERVRGATPFVLTYHNDLEKEGRLARVATRALTRWLTTPTLQRCDLVIVTSAAYHRSSPTLRRVRTPITIVPPGIDPPSGAAPPAKPAHGTQRVLFVGRLWRTHDHKGLDDLLRAMVIVRGAVPHATLEVVGTGDGQPGYARHGADLGLGPSVRFRGYVSQDDLAGCYHDADVIALPSRTASEGFGMVLLEAAAQGTPAVATTVGGIPSAVLDGETGLLVPPRDPPRLAEALITVLTDHGLRARLGDRARQRALADFLWPQQTARFLASLELLAGTWRPSRQVDLR